MLVEERGKPTILGRRGPDEDVWVHSSCGMCYSPCGILVHRVNGVVVKIEGDPDCPHNLGKLCAKGQAGVMTAYDPNRVRYPVKRTNPEKGMGVDPKWERIGWDEAMDIVTEKLKKVRADDPRKLLFATFDVPILLGSLLPPWMIAFGTVGVYQLNAYRCGAALHSITYTTNGTFHAEIDFDHCNYCMLFGSQMGFMVGIAPNMMAQKMADARARGMKLVVVDPICTNAAAKADEWVPIRPGTDGALALAMLHVLLNEQGLFDAEFIKKRTNGPYLVAPDGHYARDKDSNKPLVWDSAEGRARPFDAEVKSVAIEGSYTVNGIECHPAFQLLKDQVRKCTPEVAAPITTLPAATIRRLATEFGQAARIGSTIMIDGVELPYRPAANNFYRGICARKHGSMMSLSVQLLNLVVGAFHVPGGHSGVNLVGPSGKWAPTANPDGLMVAPEALAHGFNPYNIKSTAPTSLDIRSLFPMSHSVGALGALGMLDPDRFKVPVKPEVMVQCRTNLMMSRENPVTAANIFGKVPFIICFATHLDEVTEFADVVLPDTSGLERLVPFPNGTHKDINHITDFWYWGLQQPVVEPAYEARHWWKVLLELAERVGFLPDYYRLLNLTYLKEPFKLDVNARYSLEEIIDRRAKSQFGPEHGLEWFKENGYLKQERKPEERYPLAKSGPRLPIYFENFLQAGEAVRKTTKELNMQWDTSDYQPLPDWKPNPSYEKRSAEYDLFCVNYKTPLSSMTISSENAWLSELTERHPYFYKVMINAEAAKKRGIKDGDTVWVESVAGKVKGKAKVTECIHPEAVGISGTEGAWAKGKPVALGKGLHHNTLVPLDLERMDGVSGAVDDCIEVKVYKEEK